MTKPERPPANLLREQYLILREALLGTRFLAKKRVILASGAVALWIAVLLLFRLGAPQLLLGFVAAQYFGFAISHPLSFAVLVIITIAIFLAVIEVFDFALSKTVFRGGLLVNALWLAAAYLVSSIVALCFASICADVVAYTFDPADASHVSELKTFGLILLGSLERVGRLLLHPSATAELFFKWPADLLKPFDLDAAIYMSLIPGVTYTIVLLTMAALIAMQMTSIFGLSILNIAYFIGLSLFGLICSCAKNTNIISLQS